MAQFGAHIDSKAAALASGRAGASVVTITTTPKTTTKTVD